ncbi:uncharacterized protein JCM15063_000721 [Sporobolomyces koalae]|uniref:uncharacterized protein n=1 Tax=Sporobolomyces koalae TaxID=500713 RepID=UPI00317EFEAC
MDSPNASGYVPVSLVDTITRSNRTYGRTSCIPSTPSSSSTTTSISTSRSIHHAHSSSLAALASKERSEQARREAAEISQTLGLSLQTPSRTSFNAAEIDAATPRPGKLTNGELVTMRKQLEDKDQEIAALRREINVLTRDKKDLGSKCDQLEQLAATGGTNQGGLDAIQVDELVKQFNDQEALLGGYQREAEKSLAELDRLRTKERRLNDWFERMHGPNWAEELNLLSDKPTLASAPAFRSKPRPSILTPPPSSSATMSPSVEHVREESTESVTTSFSSVSSPPSIAATRIPGDSSMSPEALKHHLESVQALIRGMESRLVARAVELEAVEKRARAESRLAESHWIQLENLVQGLDLNPTATSSS